MHVLIQLPDGPEGWAYHPVFQKNIWVVALGTECEQTIWFLQQIKHKGETTRWKEPGHLDDSPGMPAHLHLLDERERNMCVLFGPLIDRTAQPGALIQQLSLYSN